MSFVNKMTETQMTEQDQVFSPYPLQFIIQRNLQESISNTAVFHLSPCQLLYSWDNICQITGTHINQPNWGVSITGSWRWRIIKGEIIHIIDWGSWEQKTRGFYRKISMSFSEVNSSIQMWQRPIFKLWLGDWKHAWNLREPPSTCCLL